MGSYPVFHLIKENSLPYLEVGEPLDYLIKNFEWFGIDFSDYSFTSEFNSKSYWNNIDDWQGIKFVRNDTLFDGRRFITIKDFLDNFKPSKELFEKSYNVLNNISQQEYMFKVLIPKSYDLLEGKRALTWLSIAVYYLEMVEFDMIDNDFDEELADLFISYEFRHLLRELFILQFNDDDLNYNNDIIMISGV